jgi:CRISPR-associated protein Csx16
MTVFFVSRHRGAVDWARRQGLRVDRWVEHLHADDVRAGDTVAGTLPLPLAAAVCVGGARLEGFVVRAESSADSLKPGSTP